MMTEVVLERESPFHSAQNSCHTHGVKIVILYGIQLRSTSCSSVSSVNVTVIVERGL